MVLEFCKLYRKTCNKNYENDINSIFSSKDLLFIYHLKNLVCHIKSFFVLNPIKLLFQKCSRKLRETLKSLKSAAFGFLWKVGIYISLNLTLHIKSLKHFLEVSFSEDVVVSIGGQNYIWSFVSLSLSLSSLFK